MAEQVATLLLNRHPHRVVDYLTAAHLRPDLHLARVEDHVDLLVEDNESNHPSDEQYSRDDEVSGSVDMNVQQIEPAQDCRPPIKQGKNNDEHYNQHYHEHGPHASQGHIRDDDYQEQYR